MQRKESLFDHRVQVISHSIQTVINNPRQIVYLHNNHRNKVYSFNVNLTDVGVTLPARQASWEAPTPSLRATSVTALRIPSNAFPPPDQLGRKKGSGIQLQELSPNGVQPPPPVRESWSRIDNWAEHNYPELYDQLSYPATQQDVDDLEAELECQLPPDVRESLLVHDGQDRGGKPTGILFGVALLDCEEIVEEWQLWKRVAQAYHTETAPEPTNLTPITPQTPASAALPTAGPSSRPSSSSRRQSRIFGQTARFQACRPPETIQKVYAHPLWIPLAKDFTGNNIAVDLCPGPRGTWGQVILFGRDCETKYVVARSWGAFLAAIADDFEAGEARFDRDEGFRETFQGGELRIRPCAGARDDTFMEVLKARVRLRDREIRKKRDERMRAERERGREPVKTANTVDLMVNSPLTDDNRFPSPNLPRGSDSVHGSPVIGTPIITTPVLHQETDEEEGSKKTNVASGKVVESPVLVKKESPSPEIKKESESPVSMRETQIPTVKKEPESPILVRKNTAGTENGATGLGIEEVGVVNGE